MLLLPTPPRSAPWPPALVDPGPPPPAGDVVELGEEADVLPTGERPVDRQHLRQVADQAPDGHRLGGDVVAEDRHVAPLDRQERDDRADRRRLAGAVGAEQPEGLPGPHGQVDPVDRHVGTEPAGETPALDRRGAHAPSRASASRPSAGTAASSRARSCPPSEPSAAATSSARRSRHLPIRSSAAGVRARWTARRSPEPGRRRSTRPATASCLASVLTVLVARLRAAAASVTPTPGRSATTCSSSTCAGGSGGTGQSRRTRRRVVRRNRRAPASSASASSLSRAVGTAVDVTDTAVSSEQDSSDSELYPALRFPRTALDGAPVAAVASAPS